MRYVIAILLLTSHSSSSPSRSFSGGIDPVSIVARHRSRIKLLAADAAGMQDAGGMRTFMGFMLLVDQVPEDL
jgi:hypothetical protein